MTEQDVLGLVKTVPSVGNAPAGWEATGAHAATGNKGDFIGWRIIVKNTKTNEPPIEIELQPLHQEGPAPYARTNSFNVVMLGKENSMMTTEAKAVMDYYVKVIKANDPGSLQLAPPRQQQITTTAAPTGAMRQQPPQKTSTSTQQNPMPRETLRGDWKAPVIILVLVVALAAVTLMRRRTAPVEEKKST